MNTRSLLAKVRKLEAELKRREEPPMRVVVIGEGEDFEDYDAWRRQAEPGRRYCVVRLADEEQEF